MNRQERLKLAKKQLLAAFKTFDTDASGFIEKHEMLEVMRRLTDVFGVEEPTYEATMEIFRALDVNGDEKISQVEFEVLVVEVLDLLDDIDNQEVQV